MFENVTYNHYAGVLGRSAIPDEAAFNHMSLENKLYAKKLLDDGVIVGEREEHGIDSAVCMMCEEDWLAEAAQRGGDGDYGGVLASESVSGYSYSYDNTARSKAVELNAKSAAERKSMWLDMYCVIVKGWRI